MPPVPRPHLCLVFLPGHWVPAHPAPPPPLGTCVTPRWGRPGAVASPRWPPHLSCRTGSAPSRYSSPGGSRQPGCDGREPSLRDPCYGQRLGPLWILGSFACVRKHRGGFSPGQGWCHLSHSSCDPPPVMHQAPTCLGLLAWGKSPGCQGYGWAVWGHRARGHWGSPCSAGVALRSCWPWMSSLTAASRHRSST